MRLIRVAVAAVLLGVAAAPPASAQISADTAQLIDRVFAPLNRADAPGCSIGIDRDGLPLYRRGYGMASLESRAPMTEGSIVESGSVAKQFTAGAIVYLALNGKLDLDDPVRKYIPELPDYGAPVTIRMLLHHTSGVRDMWTLFVLAGQPPGTVLYSMDQALRMIYRQRALNFPPNSEFLYSNSGFLLLAEIVHRVSGVPLARFSRDVFFRPLGMDHTQWRDDWNRVVPGRTTAYSPAPGDGFQVDMPFMSVYGAGGLLTTVGDLLRWNEQLTHPKVGGQAWADTLQHVGRLANGRAIDYGFGLFVTRYRGEREVSHGGATGGYRTFLARWPDRKLSMAVLCNVANAGPDNLAHQVADVFIGARPAAASTGAETAGMGQDDPSSYVGRYRAPETEDLLTIAMHDGRLEANLGARLPLAAAGKDRFRASAAGVDLVFRRGPDGKVSGLTVIAIDRDTTVFERIAPPPSSAAELAAFAGTYYSDELDVTYRVGVRDTALVLQVADQPEVDLSRTARDSFARAGGMALRFSRAKNNRPDGFLLFAGRVKNLHFVRR